MKSSVVPQRPSWLKIEEEEEDDDDDDDDDDTTLLFLAYEGNPERILFFRGPTRGSKLVEKHSQ